MSELINQLLKDKSSDNVKKDLNDIIELTSEYLDELNMKDYNPAIVLCAVAYVVGCFGAEGQHALIRYPIKELLEKYFQKGFDETYIDIMEEERKESERNSH